MKKVALTLASVIAAAAFAPEASAIPAFARQTGMACSACHFMKFPVLNSFGRAFKAGGYTSAGSQAMIEDEHKTLSIPSTLNGAILFKYRYVQDGGNGAKTTNGAGKTAATNEKDGMWQMGDEFSLFFGGRVAENELFKIGFLFEGNTLAGNLAAGLKLPITVGLGAVEAHVVPFTTDALGPQYGFELSSGGVMRANRWSEMRRETSAIQYNADRGADGGNASGTALVLQHELGFINYTRFSSSLAPGGNGGALPSTNFGQSYIRGAITPSVAGFDIVAGLGRMTGSSFGNLVGAEVETNQSFADFQAHGEIGGMETGIYAQMADAPVCAATVGNANCAYNTGKEARKATTVGAEFGVIPHTLALGLGYRSVSNDGNGKTDNAINLSAVYDLAMNVALHFNYAMYSGTKYDAAGVPTSRFLGMLEAAW